ncbi:MAG: DNA-binding protein [Deltaproteobacteria bacterium]
MRYRTGSVGRILLARFDHGEEIVPALSALCAKERIASGWFFLFGAADRGTLVAGPETANLPPEPVWKPFSMPHEIVGMGSVATRDGEPSLHLHASLGRGTEVLTGCIRKEGKVFLVVEAMVMEIAGVRATRTRDERSGLELLSVD